MYTPHTTSTTSLLSANAASADCLQNKLAAARRPLLGASDGAFSAGRGHTYKAFAVRSRFPSGNGRRSRGGKAAKPRLRRGCGGKFPSALAVTYSVRHIILQHMLCRLEIIEIYFGVKRYTSQKKNAAKEINILSRHTIVVKNKKAEARQTLLRLGAPGEIRTHDLPVRSRALYPLSYKRIHISQFVMLAYDR